MIPLKYKKYKPILFDSGKRSIIYKFKINKKEFIIKSKKPNSKAKARMENEAKFLKILNKYKIGPKLIDSGKNYLIYEFIKGKFFPEYIKTNNSKKIILNVLEQCRILDKLKINKKEMHHPVKHIIIDKKPVMIDFERCYYTKNPKNVTQFCQYLMLINNKLKNPKFLKILKEYKNNQSDNNFKKIKKEIKI